MAVLLTPFCALAAIGFCLSAITHIAAILSLPQPLGPAATFLFGGIFIVWLPAVLVSSNLVADFKQKDFWQAALRGCPVWMRRLCFGTFYYGIASFVVFMFIIPAIRQVPPVFLEGAMGHCMIFYAMATGILYSAIAVSRTDPARRCTQGHPVSPSAKFCEQCGAVVATGLQESRPRG